MFPHVLIRVAGGSFDRLEALNLRQAVERAEEIGQRRAAAEGLRARLSDSLFRAIGDLPQSPERVRLINARRDIFNGRRLKPETLELLEAGLPAPSREALREYVRTVEEIPDLVGDGERIFEEERSLVRQALTQLAGDQTLHAGLLLASQSLLDSIRNHYLPSGGRVDNGRDQDTEEGILKYVTRIHSKTSPFSAFTSVAMRRLSGDDGAGSTAAAAPGTRITSHVRLNGYFFEYLKGLLVRHPAIAAELRVRLNPTVRRKDGHYLFLVNSGNVEAFQRVELNSVLEAICALAEGSTRGIRRRTLLEAIARLPDCEASREEAEVFCDRLIEIGLLEYHLGVSGVSPDWDLNLRRHLEDFAGRVPIARDLARALESLRHLAGEYESQDVGGRREVLEAAYAEFRGCCMRLHESAGLPPEERVEGSRARTGPSGRKESTGEEPKEVFTTRIPTRFAFKSTQLFFEDTICEADPVCPEDVLRETVSLLQGALQELRLFDGRAGERERMSAYFSEKYGTAAAVDVLVFYETYYRDVRKPEAEKENRLRRERQKHAESEEADPAGPAPHDRLPGGKEKLLREEERFAATGEHIRREQQKAWTDRFLASLREQLEERQQEIRITLAQLRDAGSRGLAEPLPASSYGAFLQWLPPNDRKDVATARAVVNGVAPGYGKLTSRFLHLFDDRITRLLLAWNRSSHPDALLLENCDASAFNANVHPPLMPFEVWMPGGQTSRPASKQVPVTELDVIYEEKSRLVALRYRPTGKRVFVFDLAFQGWRGRSELFRLLTFFAPDPSLSLHPILGTVNSLFTPTDSGGKPAEDQVVRLPRILYEDRIVLQRRTWLIPRALLPLKARSDSDWSNFLRVHEWARALGLPPNVFIRIPEAHEARDGESLKDPHPARDDYKPQYISFQSPLLVPLFQKVASRAPAMLRIEEMLPSPEDLREADGGRRVSEVYVQWYTR